MATDRNMGEEGRGGIKASATSADSNRTVWENMAGLVLHSCYGSGQERPGTLKGETEETLAKGLQR